MITIDMCIYIEHHTPYAIILPIVGLSMACDPYFMDTFSLSDSISLWVSSFFLFTFYFFQKLDMRTLLPQYFLI